MTRSINITDLVFDDSGIRSDVERRLDRLIPLSSNTVTQRTSQQSVNSVNEFRFKYADIVKDRNKGRISIGMRGLVNFQFMLNGGFNTETATRRIETYPNFSIADYQKAANRANFVLTYLNITELVLTAPASKRKADFIVLLESLYDDIMRPPREVDLEMKYKRRILRDAKFFYNQGLRIFEQQLLGRAV